MARVRRAFPCSQCSILSNPIPLSSSDLHRRPKFPRLSDHATIGPSLPTYPSTSPLVPPPPPPGVYEVRIGQDRHCNPLFCSGTPYSIPIYPGSHRTFPARDRGIKVCRLTMFETQNENDNQVSLHDAKVPVSRYCAAFASISKCPR
jgi:hypothetical protein